MLHTHKLLIYVFLLTISIHSNPTMYLQITMFLRVFSLTFYVLNLQACVCPCWIQSLDFFVQFAFHNSDDSGLKSTYVCMLVVLCFITLVTYIQYSKIVTLITVARIKSVAIFFLVCMFCCLHYRVLHSVLFISLPSLSFFSLRFFCLGFLFLVPVI